MISKPHPNQPSPGTDKQIDSLAVQLQLNELQTRWLRTQVQSLIQKTVDDAFRAGQVEELNKLSEWGKTIDDQWNAHFKDRLAQLKKGSK